MIKTREFTCLPNVLLDKHLTKAQAGNKQDGGPIPDEAIINITRRAKLCGGKEEWVIIYRA